MSHIRVFEIQDLREIIYKYASTSALITLALAFPMKTSPPNSPFASTEVEIEMRVGALLNLWGPYPEFSRSLARGHAILAGRNIFDLLNMNAFELQSGVFPNPLTILAPPGQAWRVSNSLEELGFTQDHLFSPEGDVTVVEIEYTEEVYSRNVLTAPSGKKVSIAVFCSLQI
jgi:hypothetical protein